MGDLYWRTIEIQLSAAVEYDEDAEKILDELIEKIKTLKDAYYGKYTLTIWDKAVSEIAGDMSVYDETKEIHEVE